MNLRTIINSHNTDWWSEMTPTQNIINKLIWELDQAIRPYETKWGVYKLESLARPPLSEKVQAQVEKLNKAICDQNIIALKELVAGTIRMYDALEKNAVENGCEPLPINQWSVPSATKIYHICKTMDEARTLQSQNTHHGIILSIQELVNLYESQTENLLPAQNQKNKPEQNHFDFAKGDNVDF